MPNERHERARSKKYGVPYDPVLDAQIKAFARWKRENHRLQMAREKTRGK